MSPLLEPTARRERWLLLLTIVVLIIGAVTLYLSSPHFGIDGLSMVIFSFVFAFATAHVTLSRHLPDRDPLLLPAAALLSGWGLLMVGRLAPNFLARQTIWLLLSTLAMLGTVQLGRDLRWLRRYRYTWLLVGLALLAATLFLGVNPSGYGPRLWLGLGGAYFQPSEPLKLLMVIFLASYLAERRGLLLETHQSVGRLRLPPVAYVGPLLLMFGLTVLILATQQDLGAGMLFFFTFLVMLYLATGQWGYVGVGVLLFLAAGAIGYVGSARVALRVDGWLNPWPNADDQAFQIVQSLLALGSGKVFGQGLGLGRPTYIPAVHTDFVFAAISEEFGLLGALAVVGLYGVILLRGFRAAARASRPFEQFLGAGLTAGLVIQAWVIAAANVKLAPIAGVTLPFLSYGGSSLLSTFIALGLLLRVSSPKSQVASPKSKVQSLDSTITLSPVSLVSKPLVHIAGLLSLALLVLAGFCGYWAVVRTEWLVSREDNPRRVEYEQGIIRGQIFDREETILADGWLDVSGIATRTYPIPQVAPVIGYASLRYGTGGIESAFDAELRGEAGRSPWEVVWADLLHRLPHGRDVQLALDAGLQQMAQQALGENSGAVVLLDSQTGEVLAMGSAPTFDPARLDDAWEQLREDPAAPLVNRATQGLYQPGAVLETVVLAEGLERGLVALDEPAPELGATVSVNGVTVTCFEEPIFEGDWTAAYQAACPGPFAALGRQLGAQGLEAAWARWGLTEPPLLEVPTESGAERIEDPLVAAVGQSDLTVSPLQMGLVAATLANDGTMPAPRLAQRVQRAQGGWQVLDPPGQPQSILAPEVAQALLATWEPYGDDVLGHLGTALAGEAQFPLAWFLGVAPANEPRYAVVVLLEHPDDAHQAAEIGRALLEAAAR